MPAKLYRLVRTYSLNRTAACDGFLDFAGLIALHEGGSDKHGWGVKYEGKKRKDEIYGMRIVVGGW